MRLQETDKQAYGCLSCLCSKATTTSVIMKKDLEEDTSFLTLYKLKSSFLYLGGSS